MLVPGDGMKTTVNKIVPHEDTSMEVHVEFRDESQRTAPVVNVIVFIEKQDHPLSEIRNLAIKEALQFLPRIIESEHKVSGL
jgi:hypothetical protein